MGDKVMTIETLKSTKELAAEGQKHLEETVQAAFWILSAMNNELCSRTLWSTTTSSPSVIPDTSTATTFTTNGHSEGSNGDVPLDSIHHFDMGGDTLEQARLRYKSYLASLRVVLNAMPQNHEDLANKNKHLKHLIDQFGDLITDISTCQSPCSVAR